MDSFRQAGDLNVLETKLKKAYNTVDWNPFPIDYWTSHEPGLGHTKLATVLANSSVMLDYVVGVQEKARLMWENHAYLHWYEQYGCEKDTFVESFEVVETVIDSYTTL